MSCSRWIIAPLLIFWIALFTSPGSYGASPPPCELIGPPTPIPSTQLQSVVKGLSDPVGLYHAGDGSGRLFIIEQDGTIRILKEGRLLEKPSLNIRDRVISGGEMGLLGLAFHPHFSENHRFFVNYTSRSGGLHTSTSELMAGDHPDEADRRSERILLTIPQPYSNHNGGETFFR